MGEFYHAVERQRLILEAEEWGKGVTSLHVHSLSSMWYDTRKNDGSVTDICYNDGSIKRIINATGQIVYFGKPLKGDALLYKFSRYQT